MTSIFRTCIDKHFLNGLFNRLCKVSKTTNLLQRAHISGKINRVKRPRPPPFPYQEKEYTSFSFLEYTIERYDENSRIIVVEGPIAAGKDKFARELAKKLEMGYMPPPSFDLLYKNAYGSDIRSLNPQMPEELQTCDIETFLTNPKHKCVPAFRITHYLLKLDAYLESLLHVLSTGEGVVLNRSLYSDFIFMNAMYQAGYMNRQCCNFYQEVLKTTMCYCKRPHLVIYLDVPVNVVKERIQKRCIPYEVNSEVLTTKYLTDIETAYKEVYLPQISDHAYLLIYDWVNDGNIDDIVDDIEKIDFNFNDNDSNKLSDWIFINLSELEDTRKMYSHRNRSLIITESIVPLYEVSEMFYFGDTNKIVNLQKSIPGAEFSKGYNTDMGDKVLWKLKHECSPTIPSVIPHKELIATE
ncbi:NADH dehydrogenase [ubiquinone] 1 alpha subcomplex subunit 10, mitochondrial-like [Vespa mandarinia]|uniref:NADH dehydrogenase [ubiquinone] 1 alpha subcomplex subunit 10, mitochondrial-like n=1 Tax=Vespa mandarinia TaxID=7446 RepID=UPI001614E2B6|nr:NADH dehydrogenase [ubiquinone] 1 alpha subcomplex subunit 10, mitochondrial-like [Vespa mandarinia]